MYIHNVTFMVEGARRDEVVAWLLPRVRKIGEGLNPRLVEVCEVEGAPAGEGSPLSIAFQVEFPDAESAYVWRESKLGTLRKAFTSHFAPDALSFSSLSKIIDCNG